MNSNKLFSSGTSLDIENYTKELKDNITTEIQQIIINLIS
jgi:hypothetical protein